ncbi:hypothetical protein GCM10007205_19260 [Oxalicibacterium flavum]|uniref:Lipoprotein n=1 Tax=Oxalicibacterium flavum TaxID=179467 RepID=A0A8J2UQE5_9BURK|nr:hypothetical protein [Oxalicibacterium flavum]GGC10321.1 hypothetical protein GCM10007205_19260 [Oxalicibacterium flavum]
MNTSISRIATRFVLPVLAVGILGGCAVVPYDDGYYGSTSYSSSVYVSPAPVYVAPHFGVHYRSGPRYYPRHYQPHRPYRPGPRHHHPRPRPGWHR